MYQAEEPKEGISNANFPYRKKGPKERGKVVILEAITSSKRIIQDPNVECTARHSKNLLNDIKILKPMYRITATAPFQGVTSHGYICHQQKNS